MIAIRRAPTGALAVVLLLIALALAVPLTGAKGGNGANVKQCLKGGWEHVATTTNPIVGFVSEKECVSTAASGVALTPLIETYVAMYRSPSDFVFQGRLLCAVDFTLVNPQPEWTSVIVTGTFTDGSTFYQSGSGLAFPDSAMIFRSDPGYTFTSIGATAQPGDVTMPVIEVENTCPRAGS